ncbi:FUSC family protein [Kluyvera genomosp. 1]|uniref:FUSC family protein n=1 Tax=Kluyvera genomosp. 1 TaxID=2774053 RepID=UPI0006900B78|nr:FUSC family protein [Kluyvera genomosp. 1]
MKIFHDKFHANHCARLVVAYLIVFWMVRFFHIPDGTWPLITLIVLMGPNSRTENVVKRACHRLGGTLTGAACGMLALYLEVWCFPAAVVWVALTILLCGYFTQSKRPYMALLIGVTFSVVVQTPIAGDYHVALWRCLDVMIGAAVAMACCIPFQYREKAVQ